MRKRSHDDNVSLEPYSGGRSERLLSAKGSSVSLGVVLAWSTITIVAVAVLQRLETLGLFLVCLLALLGLNSWRLVKIAALFSLPFLIPLAIVHGILNPAFTPTSVLGPIPFRWDGFVYAALVSARIIGLTIIAVAWRAVDPDAALDFFTRLRTPLSLIILVAATFSTVTALEYRIRAVKEAQQARGLPIGPALVSRLKAVPALVLPVVTSTLVDASQRGAMLSSRGLGTTRLPGAKVTTRPSVIEVVLIASLTLALGVATLLQLEMS